MNIQGFDIGLPTTTYEWVISLLAIITTFAVLVLVALYVKYAGKGTVTFIKETLSDPTGRGDVKYLIAMLVTVFALIPMIWLGFIFGRWAPEFVFFSVGTLILGLLGLGSIDFKSAMNSGVAIMKPEPPKEVLVKTNTDTQITETKPERG